jgi:hypothetical protein
MVLSTEVTRRLMRADTSGNSLIVPHHVRKGLTRVYAVIAIPLVIWFGYSACKEYAHFERMNSRLNEFFELWYRLDDPTIIQAQREHTTQSLARIAAEWDAKTPNEIADLMLAYRDEIGNRFTIAIYALLVGLIPLLLYPIFIWVLAGFRKSQASTKAA